MRKYIDLYFTTATIIHWYPLLWEDANKEVVIDAFRFAVLNRRAIILAFVIMDTHIHLVWQILPPYELSAVRRDMLKYISQKIKYRMITESRTEELQKFIVNKKDRQFQFWKRDPLDIELVLENVVWQKINYIHGNLAAKGLDDVAYKYSSAAYYANEICNWDFLNPEKLFLEYGLDFYSPPT
jgi:putative transposase